MFSRVVVVTGIDSRADRTTIRDNHIEDAAGAGIRLGGNSVDGYRYGVDNEVSGFRVVAPSEDNVMSIHRERNGCLP